MSCATITALILTKDEERHIERCIKSMLPFVSDVLVVDSFSSDKTVEIASALGARVIQHKWKNYSSQFNYGVYECGIASDWIWRIDADEYIDEALGSEVLSVITNAKEGINGIYVRKRIDFMGRPLMHGGWFPSYHLKVFRTGHGDCEERWMDEHIRLFDGEAIAIDKGVQVDANLNDLSWWISKHNGYATREMYDMLLMQYELDSQSKEVVPKFFGTEEQRKRWLKVKYVNSPLFVRPVVNYLYRYVVKLGFLDGKEGFIWHIMQGFWYRMLVDAKVYEFKKSCCFSKEKIIQKLKELCIAM